MGLPHAGTYEIINQATGLYFDLRESSIAPNNNCIGYPRTGGANQKVKQFMVRIQAHIDLGLQWILEREGNIITLHSLLSHQAGVADKGHLPVRLVLTLDIRELSHGHTGKRSCRSSTRTV